MDRDIQAQARRDLSDAEVEEAIAFRHYSAARDRRITCQDRLTEITAKTDATFHEQV